MLPEKRNSYRIRSSSLKYNVDFSCEAWSPIRARAVVGKKIREATKMKIPCVLIVGPKDVEAGEVSVRLRDSEQKIKLTELKDFLKNL